MSILSYYTFCGALIWQPKDVDVLEVHVDILIIIFLLVLYSRNTAIKNKKLINVY